MKTAFLSGDREEARRDVCAELPQELHEKLQISREQVLNLKLLYTVLDTRRGAWWKRVVRDLAATGRAQNLWDQCTFKFVNGTELVGLIGVYVDDFLVAACDDDPIFPAALSKLKGLFHGERGMRKDHFALTDIETETIADGGFHLTQQKFLDQLETDVSLPRPFSSGHLSFVVCLVQQSCWETELVLISVRVHLFFKVHMHASTTVADTREKQTNPFDCADNTHTCQLGFLRFL